MASSFPPPPSPPPKTATIAATASTATTPTSATFWEKTKKSSKAGFDAVWNAIDKLGAPVNRLSNKVGSEAFWPTTLDKESDKAARILRSFCKDGFYDEETVKPVDGPAQKQRVLKKIPKEVIEKAVGLCIFTTMRTGLWVSGSGGSGVLIARQEDGSWSPPSGIMMHTAGLGFLLGVDIYDCVIVINNRKALEGFTNVRVTLGGEISAVAGPVGMGGIVDTELHARQAPLFTYIKSRGFYAGVQIDGTIIIERTDENERFYGEKITAKEIISGKPRHPPQEIKRLQETLRAAEGKEVDESLIPDERPPGDYEVADAEAPDHVFGVPDQEDPDPYGVRALQSEGMEIREAGTRAVPTGNEFEFKPAVTSPVNTTFQPAIEKAKSRRSTITSQSSPKLGADGSEHRASVSSSVKSPTADLPPVVEATQKGPPPVLPPRENQAGVQTDGSGDISDVRTDEEHFEAASSAGAPENMSKIEMRDDEATLVDEVEGDLAEVSLEDNRVPDHVKDDFTENTDAVAEKAAKKDGNKVASAIARFENQA